MLDDKTDDAFEVEGVGTTMLRFNLRAAGLTSRVVAAARQETWLVMVVVSVSVEAW